MAIGIITIFGFLWFIASLVMPWPNTYTTTNWDVPVAYIWGLTGTAAVFTSYLSTAWFCAWIVNFVVWVIEWIAWIANGDFYVAWAWFSLWGGVFFELVPIVLCLLYMFLEYPLVVNPGNPWVFTFWSAEFVMVFV